MVLSAPDRAARWAAQSPIVANVFQCASIAASDISGMSTNCFWRINTADHIVVAASIDAATARPLTMRWSSVVIYPVLHEMALAYTTCFGVTTCYQH